MTAIPGPKGGLLLGSLREARARPLEMMLEVTRQYGDLVQLRLGPMRMIIVNHPDHVKRVLLDNQANYGRPAFVPMIRKLVGNGLLFSEGPFWLRQRRIMQPMFHRERIAGFARTMGDAVNARVQAWRAAPGTVDVTRAMAELTFEIVGRTLFSTDLTREAAELGDAIQFTLYWLDQRTVQPLAAPLFVPTRDNLRFRAVQKLFAETIGQMIAARRNGGEQPDLLSMLMAARDPDNGEAMSDKQLHDEVLVFLIAGYETTSAALEWTLCLLAQHAKVVDRLREEQRAICADSPPNLEQLSRMPYTRAVIDEALRLYPPVYGLSRSVNADDELAGYRIPKGTQLLVSPYAMHRHPEFWPNPDAFDPERFLGEHAGKQLRYAYFPFGGGPRQCIGNAFAMLELQILVPTLIGALQFELEDQAPIVAQPRMTLRPRGPVRMRVRGCPS